MLYAVFFKPGGGIILLIDGRVQKVNPFFSVVIPVYNVKEYLPEWVNSILNQRFCDWEAILVDDGSTDGSRELCDDLAKQDTRIQVVHQKNKGLAGARNSGMSLAEGDWLLFLDSDDFFQNGFLDQLAQQIKANKEYDVYIGDYCTIKENENVPVRASCPDFAPGPACYGTLKKRFGEYYKMLDVAAWKMAVRHTWQAKKNLWFVEEVRYAEDVVWSLQLFQLCPRILYVNLPFIVYRINRPGSLTATIRPPLRNFESRIVAWKQFENGGKFANGTQDDVFASSFAANKVIGEFQSQIKFSSGQDEQYEKAIKLMRENMDAASSVKMRDVPIKRYIAAKLLAVLGPRIFSQLVLCFT